MLHNVRRGWVRCARVVLFCSVLFFATKGALADARRGPPLDLAALAQSPGFLKLMHYRAGRFGGVESEVDNPAFFLAPRGKGDPLAELEALLEQARSTPLSEPDRDVRCRFPARWAWLAEHVELPAAAPTCPRLERFLAHLDIGGVSLVYAANSLRHPASAIGHTFLLVRRRDGRTGNSVDYRGDADTGNPFTYALKAMTGQFEGYFEILAQESKLRNLLEEQDRDLWEYEVALEPDELQRFARHLWELSRSEIDYFYFKENCSYHMLGLLEAAAPRLDLLSGFELVVQPIDALHAASQRSGLLRRTRYLPSRSTRERDGPAGPSANELALRNPRYAHGPLRFNLGPGYSSERGEFFGVGFRLTLHDMLDPPRGSPELLQIQVLGIDLRYAPSPASFTVDKVEFFDLFALNPLGSSMPIAFRLRAHGERLRDAGCPSGDCFAHGLDAGLGLSWADRERVVAVYGLAMGQVAFSGAIDGVDGSFVRLGVGPEVGLRARLGFRSVVLVRVRPSYLPWQALEFTYDASASLRSALAQNVAFGLEGRAQPSALEISLASYFYF